MNGKQNVVLKASVINNLIMESTKDNQPLDAQLFGEIRMEKTLNNSLGEALNKGSIRILLLEDNIINQMLAIEMLAMLGIHFVDVVDNGYKGLEKTRSNQYDLIVTDIKMPVMDGIEFTKQLRKDNRYKTVPIIALTANVQEEQVESYYRVGMNNCLMKPVDIIAFERILDMYFT